MSVVLLSLLARPALAADVDDFAPSSSQVVGTGTLQGEMPDLPTEGFAGGLLMGFVQDPVVRSDEDGNVQDLVSVMLPIALYGGYTVADRVRIDAFAPVYAHVEAPANEFSGPAFGDLRLQAILPFGQVGKVSIGFVPRLELPTGTRGAVTHKGLAAGGHLALGDEIRDAGGWVANLGFTGSGADRFESERLGSTFDAIVGGWYRASESFRLGAEADLRASLIGSGGGNAVTSSGHLFAQQVLPSGWGITLGAGAGLIAGIGAPDYRVLAGIHYGASSPDPDGDGIYGADDLCRNLAEDFDGFEDADGCPDEDDDLDGVVDADDACPGSPEDLDGHQDADGCPDPDNDLDGMSDADDACPSDAGPLGMGGCPDTDGDLVPDDQDQCPAEPRPATERVEISDGCPKSVYLTDYLVAHDEPIVFDGRGTELQPESLPVLDAVAAMLADHPEITRLEVQAFIDDSEDARRDSAATRMRSQAVVDYLVQRGIAVDRLDPRGMGATDPVDTNRTETGRERNRRIVFRIVKVDRSKMAKRGEPEPEPVAPEELWAPTRPERAPIVDIQEEQAPEESKTKRPPRSSKKR